jgi:ribosomal protein S18
MGRLYPLAENAGAIKTQTVPASRIGQGNFLIQIKYLSGFVTDVGGIPFQSLGGLAAKQQKYHNDQHYY